MIAASDGAVWYIWGAESLSNDRFSAEPSPLLRWPRMKADKVLLTLLILGLAFGAAASLGLLKI